MGGITSPGLVVFQALKALPGGSLVSAGDVVLSIRRDTPRVEATSTIKASRMLDILPNVLNYSLICIALFF